MAAVNELCTSTLLDVAGRIEKKEISPVELTEAMLARIAEIDGKLHSYLLVTTDLAMEQAARAAAEITQGTYRGPLHGMPVALKDLVNTRGIPTTCASVILKDFKPDYDAAVVERLNAAGAVILGKLNLTEFALYGYHPDFEPPANPWNLDYWSGVSSSGSGAATAASLCFASLGTDTGGSIRFPSAACGVVGIKATFGKVSRYGVFPLSDTLDHIGPMARTVGDAAAMLQVLEGRDPRDGSTRTDPFCDYSQVLDKGIKGMRIGIDRAYSTTDTDPLMSDALFAAVDLMAKLGAEIVELTSPELADAADHWMATCSVDALLGHKNFYPKRADDYGPVFRSLLDHGAKVSAEEYARAQRQRQTTRALLDELLTDIDVMVCPAAPSPPMPQSEFPPQQVAPVEDIAPLVRFAAPTDFAGNPSITLPNGFTDDGLPLAMQFIGRHGDEAGIIRAAAAYEAATEWHEARPPI
ncbi:MAG: amidase [Gammaproteobacteria bacterium]|nr:amidase [Gammaproteobacteria bacterium]